MYVNYDFYKDTLGGLIPEDKFAAVEAKAEAHISYLTYINGDIFAKESDRVKLAVCAAAEVIYKNMTSNTAGAGVKSESNDGYSVTYVTEAQDGQTAEEALRKKVYEAIRLYLLPTGWLSRKVKIGGHCDECADCSCNI
ncbi:MAG: hypothetical protein PUD03_04000 [Lachnospiraceae bacterium]|nr:hypothetical protein [Lachnospiraceae bacterium]